MCYRVQSSSLLTQPLNLYRGLLVLKSKLESGKVLFVFQDSFAASLKQWNSSVANIHTVFQCYWIEQSKESWEGVLRFWVLRSAHCARWAYLCEWSVTSTVYEGIKLYIKFCLVCRGFACRESCCCCQIYFPGAWVWHFAISCDMSDMWALRKRMRRKRKLWLNLR